MQTLSKSPVTVETNLTLWLWKWHLINILIAESHTDCAKSHSKSGQRSSHRCQREPGLQRRCAALPSCLEITRNTAHSSRRRSEETPTCESRDPAERAAAAAPDPAQLAPEAQPGESARPEIRQIWFLIYGAKTQSLKHAAYNRLSSSACGSGKHQRCKLPALAFPG